MQPIRTLINRSTHAAAALAVAGLAFACSDSAGIPQSALLPGDLGNGSFTFACDDSVACSPTSDVAKKFPSAVALGSTFRVSFVPKTDKGLQIHFDEQRPDRGITLSPASSFLSRGPAGFAAIAAGYESVIARDSAGLLIDYVALRVAPPDGLTVYDAESSGPLPPKVSAIKAQVGDRLVYRTVAQERKTDLAGAFKAEWTSGDASILEVQGYSGGQTAILAKAVGKTTITVAGAALTQQIPVEVMP